MSTYELKIFGSSHKRFYTFKCTWSENGWNIDDSLLTSTIPDKKQAVFLSEIRFAELDLFYPNIFGDIMERIWEGISSGTDSDAETTQKFQQLSDWLSDINRNVPDL